MCKSQTIVPIWSAQTKTKTTAKAPNEAKWEIIIGSNNIQSTKSSLKCLNAAFVLWRTTISQKSLQKLHQWKTSINSYQ